jgi:phosphohistidine phosphatase
MRHGKAIKEASSGFDYDRGLEERGKNDVSEVIQSLAKTKFLPELIVASPAKRTLKTAEIALAELKLKKDKLLFESSIYEAHFKDIFHVIRELDDNYKTVLLIGHNPSITSMVGLLTPSFIEHTPTSGLHIISLKVSTWQLVLQPIGKLELTIHPKHKSTT